MRRGLLVGGILLLLIGVVLVVLPLLNSASVTIPHYNGDIQVTPSILGSGTMSLKWSGGSASTFVAVFACDSSGCSTANAPIANSSGASGTLTASVKGGTTYAITEFGSAPTVDATISFSGLTATQIGGIALLVVGAALAFVGWRSAPRPARDHSTATAEPLIAAVAAGATSPTPNMVATPYSMPEVPAGRTEQMEYLPPASTSPVPGSTRAARKCAHCGAMNEPWITNCRSCQRPLASTGSS